MIEKTETVRITCDEGKHRFYNIVTSRRCYDECFIVDWCEICGSIRTGVEVDGRFFNEKIRNPSLLDDYIGKIK